MAQIELVIFANDPGVRSYFGPADGIDGELRLPRQPPFNGVIGVGPAALVVVDFSPDSARLAAAVEMFNAWFHTKRMRTVIASDGKDTWIQGQMRCTEVVIHEGIQTTVAVPPPISWAERDVLVNGKWQKMRLPYRPQPTFQWITRDVHTYVLAADSYEFIAPPIRPPATRREPGIMGVMVH